MDAPCVKVYSLQKEVRFGYVAYVGQGSNEYKLHQVDFHLKYKL